MMVKLIGEMNEIQFSHNIILNNLDVYSYINAICIGYDLGKAIFIKNDSNFSGVFVDTIDTEEDINQNNSIYRNIYYYLNFSIGNVLEISLEESYNELKKGLEK
jgi:hypothetical protein